MILELKNIYYKYNNRDKYILDDINLSFEKEQMYAILGESGSGKTTLLSLLAGLDLPTRGKIVYSGQEVNKHTLNLHRKKHISLVFQNYNLIDYLTAEENVRLGGKIDSKKLLESVGILPGEFKRYVMQLSGGQQQRVAIARALASDAGILLADEPTGNLDKKTETEIINLLYKSAHEMGKCVIVVTHSNVLAERADQIIKLENGKAYKVN